MNPMNSKFNKVFKKTVAILTILLVVAAPVLQAVSFAEEFDQGEKACNCCCCATPDQESSCPVKSQMSEDRCPCSVTETLPFNSKPIESATPNQVSKYSAVENIEAFNLFESIKPVSLEIVAFDIASKTHPPFYILHASLLI